MGEATASCSGIHQPQRDCGFPARDQIHSINPRQRFVGATTRKVRPESLSLATVKGRCERKSGAIRSEAQPSSDSISADIAAKGAVIPLPWLTATDKDWGRIA